MKQISLAGDQINGSGSFGNGSQKWNKNIDLIVTRPLIGVKSWSQPTSDKRIGITGLLYIYKY